MKNGMLKIRKSRGGC
ncbi:hypothetical protein Patl1_30378 [Pistacia atlantica]|uniref:Uncharacterized protein n=1 Tax=Pistacia atlantica TaxID=434234 RepID=A0ACC1ABH5_9ROSI|nr:hypothetical protein Patl1_30378 [Pistacia atlantica]